MCTNGTRIVTWDNGNNINLAPLPISKNAFVDVDDEVSLEITVFHITPPEDYQIFDAFNTGNISLVMDLIENHKGVNAVDEWGQSILMAAVVRGSLPVVASLLNTRMPRVNVNMAKPVNCSPPSAIFIFCSLDTLHCFTPFSSPLSPP